LLVSCDLPFDLVDKPKFQSFVNRTHTRMPLLQIPSSKTVRRHVMKMGNEMEEQLKCFINVCFLFSFFSNVKLALRIMPVLSVFPWMHGHLRMDLPLWALSCTTSLKVGSLKSY
jgi:hypothetical protein